MQIVRSLEEFKGQLTLKELKTKKSRHRVALTPFAVAVLAEHRKTMLAAGLYQLTPFKNACLSHCRSPAEFIAAHWRPGPWGAWRIGLAHGAYCVGCCSLLMLCVPTKIVGS